MYRRHGSEIPPVVVSKALRGALIAAVLGCSPANVGDVIPVGDGGPPPQDIPPFLSDRYTPRDIPPIPIRDTGSGEASADPDGSTTTDRPTVPDAGPPRCGAGIDSDGGTLAAACSSWVPLSPPVNSEAPRRKR